MIISLFNNLKNMLPANNELNYSWLILDENTISSQDYVFWVDTDLKIPTNTNKTKHYYNQGEIYRTRNACALYWSAWAISDLTWYKFTTTELLEIVDLAEKKYWWVETQGMYMSKAVDCLRNWWNIKNPNNKLITFRLEIWDEKFEEALDKNHSLVVWYKTSSEYYKDSQDDWKISKEDFPKKWWHLVRTNFNNVIKIDDNYFWKKKYNTYENEKLIKLKENWVFFNSAYLFLFEKPAIKFAENSEYSHLIDLNWFIPFNDYTDNSNLKELITIALQRYEKYDRNK